MEIWPRASRQAIESLRAYYLDLGTGDSDLTWQAMLGLGYRFDWDSANLALRRLSYDFAESDDSLRFTGPAMGVSFLW